MTASTQLCSAGTKRWGIPVTPSIVRGSRRGREAVADPRAEHVRLVARVAAPLRAADREAVQLQPLARATLRDRAVVQQSPVPEQHLAGLDPAADLARQRRRRGARRRESHVIVYLFTS